MGCCLRKINKSLSLFIFIFFHPYLYADQKKIITTIPYLTDLVQNVTCKDRSISIQSVIQPETDPHTFAISLKNRVTIERSDMVIQIGNKFEDWLNKVPKRKEQIWFSIASPSLHDFHIWQSPKLTKLAAQEIGRYIQNAKFLTKEQVELCTRKYLIEIDQTVEDLKKQIEKIPKNKRILATNHDSLSYFAQEFGFKFVSLLGTNDHAQPTPQQIRNIIEFVKKQHVNVIFLESTGDMKNLKTISNETGVKIDGKLFGDSLGPKNSGADGTIGMWKTNVKTIMKALR